MAAKQNILIEAQSRSEQRANVLRNDGFIPGVLYGHGVDAKSLFVPASVFEKIYRSAGESTIVQLKVGESAPVNVLIQDIQRHGTRGEITHVDFYQVKMTEKLEATVPLKFVGEAPSVRELQGTFVPTMDEVDVRSLPMDLPSEIEVDISGLKSFDDVIRIKDLKVDHSKVEILVEDPEMIVAAVQAPKSEEELAADLAAPTEVNIEEAVEGLKKEEGEAVEGQASEAAEGEHKE